MSIEVTTQTELDAAVAAHPDELITITGAGWFTVSSGRFASDSASVRAYGSASVEAYDSASVMASGSASVEASGSASVRAYDSASVRASGSASVRASDSASVMASGSASVRASDSASVRASCMVAVHNHNPDNKYGTVKITGGVIIDVRPAANLDEWFADNIIEPVDGVVTLYKAVDDGFKSGYGFDYTPGTVPVAPDWDGGVQECGGGLHFCAAPWIARSQFNRSATRFVACPILVSDIAFHPGGQLPSKVKAKGCCAPVWECDIDGNPVQS